MAICSASTLDDFAIDAKAEHRIRNVISICDWCGLWQPWWVSWCSWLHFDLWISDLIPKFPTNIIQLKCAMPQNGALLSHLNGVPVARAGNNCNEMRWFNLARSVEVCVCVCYRFAVWSEYSLRKYIKWNFQFNIDGVLLDFSSILYIGLRDFDYYFFFSSTDNT